MKTSIVYQETCFAKSRNGRKFGLNTSKLLALAIKARQENRISDLKAVQRTLAQHASHRVGR